MKKQFLGSILIFLISILNAQNEEFTIGMFGGNETMKHDVGGYQIPYEVPVVTVNNTSYYTSNYTVFAEDGFNLVNTGEPGEWTSANVLKSKIKLIGANGLKVEVGANRFFKPDLDASGNYSGTGTNIYDNCGNSIPDHIRPFDGGTIGYFRVDFNHYFNDVFPSEGLKDIIWGYHVSEEASYHHYQHFDPDCDGPGWGDAAYFKPCERQPERILDAMDYFKGLLSNKGITNHKMVIMSANHHRSIHENTIDPKTDLGGDQNLYHPQQYIKLLDKSDSRDVFFEGSYASFPELTWETAPYTRISDLGPDNYHYLGQFKSIEYGKEKCGSVHKVLGGSTCRINKYGEIIEHYDEANHKGLIYHLHSDPNKRNANWLWFQAYNSIIHGVDGIWFWSFHTMFQTGEDHTVFKDGGDIDRFKRENFPFTYKAYVSNLARELNYLKDKNILKLGNTVVYNKTDHADKYGIVPPASDYIDSEHISNFLNVFPTSDIKADHVSENYGLRYTIRSNGDETYMIITNPLNVAIENVELDFSNLANPNIRNAEGVDVLFESNQIVTSSNYKVVNSSVDFRGTIENGDVSEKFFKPFDSDKKLSLSFGPLDVHILKFVSNPPNYDNSWNNVWSNFGSEDIAGYSHGDTKKYLPGDFDGDGAEELLCINTATNGWITMLDYYEEDWHWKWSTNGSTSSNKYIYNFRDNLTVGDFDGDGVDELLGVSSYGIRTFKFQNGEWVQINYVTTTASMWPYRTDLISGDFDGDGKDEVFGKSATSDWLVMFDFESNAWVWGLTNQGSAVSILDYTEDLMAGDFDGDGRDEILGNDIDGSGDGSISIFSFSGSGFFEETWNSIDAGNTTMYDFREDLMVGDFDGDGIDDVLGNNYESNSWMTMFKFYSGTFHWGWSTGSEMYLDDLKVNEYREATKFLPISVYKDAPSYLLAFRFYDPTSLINLYSFTPSSIIIVDSNTGESNDWDVQYTDGADVAYLIHVPNRSEVTATTCYSQTDFNTKIEIFNLDGTTTGNYNCNDCSITNTSSTIVTELDEGYYYVVVDGLYGVTGNYLLTIAFNNSYTIPFIVNGSTISKTDDWDVKYTDGPDVAYKFYLPQETTLKADLCNQYIDFNSKIEIFKEDGTSTGNYNLNYSCEYSSTSSTIANFTLDEGYYYAVVDGYNGATGNYQLSLSEVELAKSIKVPGDLIMRDVESEGDENTILNAMNVYPNPAQDEFNISLTELKQYQVRMINASGAIIKEFKVNNNKISINCSEMKSGIYILIVSSNDEIFKQKLVINK